jgi:hypothetical protein
MISFSSNDYLGLAHAPEVVAAATRALHERGFGVAGVRLAFNTQDLYVGSNISPSALGRPRRRPCECDRPRRRGKVTPGRSLGSLELRPEVPVGFQRPRRPPRADVRCPRLTLKGGQ